MHRRELCSGIDGSGGVYTGKAGQCAPVLRKINAEDYFRHSGDDLRLAQSLYTNGRVEYDLGNHAEAAELYVEAMDVAKGSEDYNIQYLICSHLGTIYYKTKMSEKALAFYIKLFYWLFYV